MINYYPERVVPEDGLKFDYIDHLARYDYIKTDIVDKYILDCGCGNGYGSFDLASIAQYVVGVDYAYEAIQYANSHYKKLNLKYTQMDGQNLAFPNSSFDIICSFDVIEHIPYPESYLREVTRVLRPNGIAYISTPNRNISSPGLSLPKNPYHLREYDINEFNEILVNFFHKVEILGEFEDQELQIMKLQTSNLRTIWRLTDRIHLRNYVSKGFRQSLLKMIIKITSGGSLDSINENNIIFSKDNIEVAPTFFAICKN